MKNKNICGKNMSFSDCELTILRMQVDKAKDKISRRIVNTPEIKEMFEIVENFIKKKNLICYGGISINAFLPSEDKIYNQDIDLPDYDFFSPNAIEDAKELANIYAKNGSSEVEARSGQHKGTYKVFVNFIGVADITYIPNELFNVIKKNAVRINGILYTDPNFLKMSMYLELSRPSGDTTRWEKVLKRLTLLNKYYPLETDKCDDIDFQRKMIENEDKSDIIFDNVKNTFINQGVVFFGGYALSEYSQYMPEKLRKKIEKYADFDVLSRDPKTTAEIVKERLKDIGIIHVNILKRDPIGDVIPIHYEIKVGKDTIAFIYKPVACHSYNVIFHKNKKIKIASIDTMLSFYLAFLYSDRPYYDTSRILCMSKFLFDVQQKNRLKQKGLLKRFSIICYGHQDSVEEIRAEKAKRFKELKGKQGTKEYEEWFLNYKPFTQSTINNTHFNKTKKNITKHNSQSNSSKKYSKNKTIKKKYYML